MTGCSLWILLALAVFLLFPTLIWSALISTNTETGGIRPHRRIERSPAPRSSATWSWTQYQLHKRMSLNKRSTVQLCGQRLVEAVKAICKGELFSGGAMRHSNKAAGKGMYSNSRSRSRRSISDKCCKQACSIADLVRYCGGTRG